MPRWEVGFPEREPRRYDPRTDPYRHEKQLQEDIRRDCKALGLLYYHTHVSKNSPSGFLDSYIGRPKKMLRRPGLSVVVAELKTPWNPNPTPTQRAYLDHFRVVADTTNAALGYTFMEVFLWTHEEMTEIKETLAEVAGLRRPTSRAG